MVEAPASIFISGLEEGDRFGRSVSFASDVNGDGIDDVIVGSSDRRRAVMLAKGLLMPLSYLVRAN